MRLTDRDTAQHRVFQLGVIVFAKVLKFIKRVWFTRHDPARDDGGIG
jgi:hypothetical protein